MNSKSKFCHLLPSRSAPLSPIFQVFVGGLSLQATDEQMFWEFSAKFGHIIEARIMRFRDGRSRGFGFVQFASHQQYLQALGSKVVVNSQEVECRPSMTPEEAARGARQLLKRKLILYGITEKDCQNEITSFFQGFGEIIRAKYFKNTKSVLGLSQGYIEFKNPFSISRILSNIDLPRLIELRGKTFLVYSAEAKSSNTKSWKDAFKLKYAKKRNLVTEFPSVKSIVRSQVTTDDQSPQNIRQNLQTKFSSNFAGNQIFLLSTFPKSSEPQDHNLRFNLPKANSRTIVSLRIDGRSHFVLAKMAY